MLASVEVFCCRMPSDGANIVPRRLWTTVHMCLFAFETEVHYIALAQSRDALASASWVPGSQAHATIHSH